MGVEVEVGPPPFHRRQAFLRPASPVERPPLWHPNHTRLCQRLVVTAVVGMGWRGGAAHRLEVGRASWGGGMVAGGEGMAPGGAGMGCWGGWAGRLTVVMAPVAVSRVPGAAGMAPVAVGTAAWALRMAPGAAEGWAGEAGWGGGMVTEGEEREAWVVGAMGSASPPQG